MFKCRFFQNFRSFCQGEKSPSQTFLSQSRIISIGHKYPPDKFEERFPDNTVVSSKYTIWNFIPKNLYEQFQRIANFYFLCVAIIQLSINSPVSPLTSLTPLTFVVTITAIKQGYEDWQRHKTDRSVNHTHVSVIRSGKEVRIRSQDIRVGDIVKVKSDEEFPCDLVMLSSSDAGGVCYITTANLDGETNLKIHNCLPQTQEYQTPESFNNLHATIECDKPTANLYKFRGNMTYYQRTQSSIWPLGSLNLLLKGARLKNTAFIYGCCVYTGPETKLSLNLKLTYNKFSTVERSMNRFLIIFLVLLALEASFATGIKYLYQNDPVMGTAWYLPLREGLSAKQVFSDLLVFVVLFNYVIPISLYVTIEMVKFMGSMFLTWDAELYDKNSNEFAMCNSSDLNEELGQVQYLFTDKTGTLTENDMIFKHCSIDGIKYTEHDGMLCKVSNFLQGNPEPVFQYVGAVENFLLVLALCNTVQTFKNGTLSDVENCHDHYDLEYYALSPDEKALVEACRRFGVVLLGVFKDTYHVSFKGKHRRFEQLHTLEFDFTRKCMSTIIRNEQGRIYLLCKGAESTVLSKCVCGLKETTLLHVNDYAMHLLESPGRITIIPIEGLRTLVVAYRELSKEEFQSFDKKYKMARTEIVAREEEVSRVIDEIEQNMTLLGATAVDDKLQDGVCETLVALKEAGIKIWVLTGDKEETAVNICYSSGHFQRDMEVIKLAQEETSAQYYKKLVEIKMMIEEETLKTFALVVDGHILAHILHEYCDSFYEVCRNCTAVLCCRMSPMQKAEIVKFIKHGSEKVVTAAIGDGANDVSMIQEAHVGLGIIGKEGRQAVRCSDFAFARFQFLQRILLVHGHYYYIRISTLVQYFFYKNIAFITPQVYYTIFSAFSGQPLYHSFYLMFYNIFFTSFPILIYGLTEQHLSQKTLLNKPHLYRNIRGNAKMTKLQFVKWIVQGAWHSVVLYFGIHLFWRNGTSCFLDGQSLGVWSFGTTVFHTLIFIVNLKLGLHTRYWTKMFVFSLLATIFSFIGFSFLYGRVTLQLHHNVLFGVYIKILSSPSVWFLSIILVVIALLPDLLFQLLENYSFSLKKIFGICNRYYSVNSINTETGLLGDRCPSASYRNNYYDENREMEITQRGQYSGSIDITEAILLDHQKSYFLKEGSDHRDNEHQAGTTKLVMNTHRWSSGSTSTEQEEKPMLETSL
ncbi:phospholipid-transporting ATPase IF-like isoform X2 [Tachypleus tridentatus]|uniref:phospholipid-transporting ATPase IF-like isoform X2 n=1 Tax=Tachypleus tridentatus TaxID=6853 RepID=UPI003FD6310F